jgi:hypothetical protein
MSHILRLNSELPCDECGNRAAIRFVQVPYAGKDMGLPTLDQRSASWTYIIDCPKCGRREQAPREAALA